MWNVDSRRGCVCMGTGCVWESFVLSARFCCESKTALKNKVYQLKKEWSADMCYNIDKPWNHMLSERSQSQKSTYYRIPLIWQSGVGKSIIETGSILVAA